MEAKGESNVKALRTACLVAAAMFVIPSLASAALPHDVCEGPLHPAEEVTVAAGMCEGHK